MLLGWKLLSESGGSTTGGRIVEVEAYHGANDPASHAYRGRTPRTAPMFELGGTIYVYFSYGMHTCVNIVTGPAGEAGAVLIRALEPGVGLEVMTARRGHTDLHLLTSGPGRLTQALGITLELSGTRLGGTLSIQPPSHPLPPNAVVSGPRVGISRAADRPWRFWVRGNPFVSRSRV
jgi:DNA-3-methyladenine glycosylase